LGRITALDRAIAAFGSRGATRKGGRKERESENKDRGSTSEHLDFFVEWRKV